MVWTKTLPLGTKAGNLLDNDIRDNNEALEAAVDAEHVFASGEDQTGKHKFAVEDEATRDGDSDYVAGSLSITTDTVSGEYVLTFAIDDEGIEWHTPLDAFLNNANDWVLGQYHTTTEIATVGANIASVWTEANIFKITLTVNATLDDPTEMPDTGTKSGVWYYIITQHSTAVTLGFGAKFKGSPVISDQDDSVNVLQCVMDDAGNIQAQFLAGSMATAAVPGIVELATDAEAAAMNATDVVITPSNMSAVEMGTGTGAKGWAYLFGHSSGYGQFVIQWETLTTDANPDTITWSKEFASSTYSVFTGPSVGCGTHVNWSGRTSTTVDIEVQAGSGKVVSVMAIGPIADL